MILASHGIIGSQITQFVGLLDDYSGASAAYSLRLLRSAYTGSAIRVRRASDNTEQDIGFVSGELDTSTLTSFCSGTNGFVKTWYDQSGNGYDATQATASAQPQIVSSGSVILENGKPSVDFDGSDDYLDTGNSAIFNNDIYSPFITIKPNSISQDTTFTQSGRNGQSYIAGGFGGVGTNAVIGTRIGLSNNTNVPKSEVLANTNTILYSAIGNTTTASNDGYLNSQSMTGSQGCRSTLSMLSEITIGARNSTSFHCNSKIMEFIIYNSDQSSNRTGIETNINDFYSIY